MAISEHYGDVCNPVRSVLPIADGHGDLESDGVRLVNNLHHIQGNEVISKMTDRKIEIAFGGRHQNQIPPIVRTDGERVHRGEISVDGYDDPHLLLQV